MFNLSGKVAVVTGGGSGIGRAIALTFARQGASLVVLDLDEAAARDTADAIAAGGGRADGSACDVADSAKFGVPVCPHAGGVGLCEYVQHLSMFDFIGISGTMDGRVIEFVDHLHEHFEEPVEIRRGRYMAPSKPGYSITIKPESRMQYRFPDGGAWREPHGR